jgi:hypothetical protein
MEIPVGYFDRMRAAFPALSLSTVQLNRDGLMNDVVIVNNEWVFRFAKDERAKRSLLKEARILSLARAFVSVDVPLFDIEVELFPLLMTTAQDWIRRHFAPVLEGKLSLDYEPSMIHGDLAPYHLLFQREMHRLTGIIDFGTAGRGDPATDFALIIAAFGESFLRRMAPFYPRMSQAIDRARFWAGTLELQWALGGLRSHDLSWLVCHIGWARDVQPLGIPWAS